LALETKSLDTSTAEQVILKEKTAALHMSGGTVKEIPSKQLVETVQEYGLRGLSPEALPDNVKWKVECGPLSIYILELKPDLRSICWISPKSRADLGPKASYDQYRLATPFIVLKVPFLGGMIQPRCELFYRNQPLRRLEDELYWCNLLNVSPNSYHCTAWICTQYLGKELHLVPGMPAQRPGILRQLDALVTHLWGGGFNRSSEHHEGQSCFSKAVQDGLDPRVTSVDRWQKESLKDPNFVLKVAWKPTGLTVGSLLDRHIKSSGVHRDLSDTAELISTLLGPPKKRGRTHGY